MLWVAVIVVVAMALFAIIGGLVGWTIMGGLATDKIGPVIFGIFGAVVMIALLALTFYLVLPR